MSELSVDMFKFDSRNIKEFIGDVLKVDADFESDNFLDDTIQAIYEQHKDSTDILAIVDTITSCNTNALESQHYYGNSCFTSSFQVNYMWAEDFVTIVAIARMS